MGGAVSSGRDNNELVDNLMSGSYIRTRVVERVFRVLDRADYMSPEARDQAYKDLAWRNGPLHLSAPCIYSEVMEALDLKPGLSFLNIGSGTGYLSTLVGLIIGSSGISHGVEALPFVFEYANKKLSQFIENSVTLDEFDFCFPKYYMGNGLCLAPTQSYDRVYCGAGVLEKHENYFKQLTKVGGVLVMPLADTLVQMRRVSNTRWSCRNLLNVSFALLREPAKDELDDLIKLEEQCPPSLQVLSRGCIRAAMCGGVMRRQPELREPATRPAAPRVAKVTRNICMPFNVTDDDDLNELHDLDEAGGANEMNALLSLVLSMGQSRAAGSLRLDPVDDEELDQAYPRVGEMFPVEEREDASPPPLLPNDGIIVFDVDTGAVRARRWQPRPPRAPRTPPPGTSRRRASASAERSPPRAPRRRASADGSPAAPRAPPAHPAPAAPDPPAADEAPAAPRRAAPPSRPLYYYDSGSDDELAPQVKDNKRQKLDSGIGEGPTSSGASPDKSDSTPSKCDDGQDIGMLWCETQSERSATSSSSDSDGDGDGDAEGEGEAEGEGQGPERREGGGAVPRTRANDLTLQLELKRRKIHAPPVDEGQRTAEICRRIANRRRGRSVMSVVRGANESTSSSSSGSDSGAEMGSVGGGGGAGGRRGGGRRAGPDQRRVQLSLAMKRAVKELPLPHALKKYVNYGRCYQF